MMGFLALLLTNIVYYSCANPVQSSTIPSISKDFYERISTNPQTLQYDKKTSLLEIEENGRSNTAASVAKARFKRQQGSGAGKFTEAAQVPQLKLLRLFLTMFKNTWAPSFTGGSHPFHPYVPKPIVQLYKQRIVAFFFPDIGEDAIKKD